MSYIPGYTLRIPVPMRCTETGPDGTHAFVAAYDDEMNNPFKRLRVRLWPLPQDRGHVALVTWECKRDGPNYDRVPFTPPPGVDMSGDALADLAGQLAWVAVTDHCRCCAREREMLAVMADYEDRRLAAQR